MIGINCLQDLKKRFISEGIEVKESQGWYFITAHGRWTMSGDDLYLDGVLTKTIPELVKKKSKKGKKE